jgi:hypothetical protein
MTSIDSHQNPKMPKTNSLVIAPVQGRKALNKFICLPWSLYQDDPLWVPPLLLERRMHLSPKNPYFEHATYSAWMAYRDSKPVGRISAQVDRLHLDRYRDATGFFGMLEADDEAETFQALLDMAESWLRDQGMQRVLGPFNLSVNQECGLLVAGFDTPPSIMMGHARPYYGTRIEQCGYQKVKDLLAYIIRADFERSAAMKTITARAKGRVQTRPIRKYRFQEDLDFIQDIYNDAWSQNWGFIPFTKKEFEHMGKDLKLLVDEELVRIAEVDGFPAAFIVVLPNINEVIQDLDGRLLPFGWLKMLWRLKVKYPKTARIPLMGVRRKYHDSLLGAALAYMLIGDVQDPGIRRGLQEVELSWILEDNIGMRNIIENISGRAYKTYRIYTKNL